MMRSIKIDGTLRLSNVKATFPPRTSFKKILLKERSMIRESSIDFAMNCPMTLKMCVRLLVKTRSAFDHTRTPLNLQALIIITVVSRHGRREQSKRMMDMRSR